MTPIMALAFILVAANESWVPVDDAVMGGLSASRAVRTVAATLLFTGEVSLENNGGFASIRTAPQQHDLSGAEGIELWVRGDGKRYRIAVRTEAGIDGVQYQAAFNTRGGDWQEVRIPFADFEPRFRGRLVPGAPPLDPAAIRTFGLSIADRQAGSFQLEIDTIRAWGATP